MRECREYELPEPELIDFEGDFRVNLYRREGDEFAVDDKTTQTIQTTQSDAARLSEDDRAVLTLVHHHPAMSQKEYAFELGWTVERVKYYLRKMKMQRMINRVGSSHNGHWEILTDWDAPTKDR